MSDPIIAEAADGSSHEFPSDTNPAVVDRVMKQYAMQGKIRSRMSGLPDALKSKTAANIASEGMGALDPILGANSLLDKGVYGLGQLVTSAGGLYPNKVSNWMGEAAHSGEKVSDSLNANLQGLRAESGQSGFDPFRLAGNIASPVNAAFPAPTSLLDAAATGGAFGAIQPTSEGQSPLQPVANAAMGAGGGTAGYGAGKLMSRLLGGAAPPPSAEDKAKSLILGSLGKDNIDPQNAVDMIGRYPDKPLTLMDTGGSNTARLGRTINTLGGEPGEQMAKFLSERSADQSGRVVNDIAENLANGSDVHAIGQKLIEQQQAAAKPLYDAAYAANKNIASPDIDKILETPAGSKALSTARTMMQNDMRLMGVPDAELRVQASEAGQAIPKGGVASGLKLETLDYVKKALDDQIEPALRSGEKRQAGILIGLKNKLLDAIDAADSTLSTGPNSERPNGGLYKQARAAFSGPAQSMDAIENGKSFLNLSPEELKDAITKLPANNKQFFQVGAGRALQDRINSVADNRDAVARVFGSASIRKQIDAVFGTGAATKFAEAMTPENMMTATNRFVTGGSNTMNKAADLASSPSIGEDMAMGALHGGVKGAIMRPIINTGSAKIKAFFNGMTPEVRNAMAEMLTRTGAPSLAMSPRIPANPAINAISQQAGGLAGKIPPALLAQLLQRGTGAPAYGQAP